MKAKLLLCIPLLCSFVLLCGCKDDDDKFSPSSNIEDEFNTRYPSAKDVTWDSENGYTVAKFRQGTEYSQAWFTGNALWVMTNTAIQFPALPQAIQDSYNGSYYADWNIDDVMRLERIDTKMLYIIEVDKDPYSLDLQYASNGILINVIPHQSDELYLPVTIPQEVKDFIAAKYPAGEIMQYSKIGYDYVADVLEGVTPMHVAFDKNYNWLRTYWEVYTINLPQPVKDSISAKYPGYKVLFSRQVESPAGTTYIIRMVSTANETEVTFDPDGNVVAEKNL